MDSITKLDNAVTNLNDTTIIELAIEVWYKDYIPDISIYKNEEHTIACNVVYLLSLFSVCSKHVARAIQASVPKINSKDRERYSDLIQALLPYQTRHYADKHYGKTL